MKWTVSCLQFDISYGNPSENIKKAESFIERESRHADVLVLPELWTTGYDLTRLDKLADENGEASKQWLRQTAKTYNVHLVAGSVAVKEGDNVYNTMYIADNSGQIKKQYQKAHLFQLMDEHLYLSAGSSDGFFELDGVKCAGLICYDIRFPEWVRKHTAQGANVLFISAEWPLPRLDHWKSLLVARAIENQCFVAACNCTGSNPDNEFAGHSLIIDPWGRILAEGGQTEGAVRAEIDVSESTAVRSTIPVFHDLRSDLY
ncbi:carbon-nitrogen family hydrolase [Bacillus nakamurai]|uniref:Hydrolase n=1 Tax=Bacillus nakamurai TaxID=1793963 RepID=A0A150F213_9BACI|nr:carbon-nitrogen family hydrolase [Bacillus nakamurai]KXZ12743.1 hydrolase [Bacillus nakamurai]MCC9024105.1 carbon-nitrogen family hydrolase [Bacillus nakamurai]MED1228238.1 carbon-nitrogen family hydrolase [Bacillus nakamurai]